MRAPLVALALAQSITVTLEATIAPPVRLSSADMPASGSLVTAWFDEGTGERAVSISTGDPTPVPEPEPEKPEPSPVAVTRREVLP